jgi:hypothetical protein
MDGIPQSFEDAFKGQRAILIEKLDAMHGLLNILLDKDVITKAQKQDCESVSEHQRAGKLLDILSKRPDRYFVTFCDALERDDQGHIVQLLNKPQDQRRQTTSRILPPYPGALAAPPLNQSQPFPVSQPPQNQAFTGGAAAPAPAANFTNFQQQQPQDQQQQQQQPHQQQQQQQPQGNGVAAVASSPSPAAQPLRTNLLPTTVLIVPFSKLSEVKMLTSGGFGVIHRARHADWGTVVYKELQIDVINPREKNARELMREAQAHVLRHSNIAAVLGVIFEQGHYGVLLEYAPHGSLDNFIGKYEVDFLMKMALAHGVAQGVNYIHTLTQPVIHGDLRIQNVMVGDGYVAKISDFGLSKWHQFSTTVTRTQTRRATIVHIPPESWVDINLRRNAKYDVYGFAILLWELLSENSPFGNAANVPDQIRVAVMDGQRPSLNDIDDKLVGSRPQQVPADMLTDVKQLIDVCWAQDPNARPSFADVTGTFVRLMSTQQDALATAKAKLDEGVAAAADSKSEPATHQMDDS